MQPRADPVGVIAAVLELRGESMYGGEAVTQKAHALQCAWIAEREGATDALIVAALLHDVGHLLLELPDDVAARVVDQRHEDAGQQWLSRFFGPEVTEPVRLHVEAKRYLCASDPLYAALLSTASRESLLLQRGPLRPDELSAFEDRPFARDAVLLRRWDDRAKIPGLVVPGLAHYAPRIQAVVRAHESVVGSSGVQ